jgi:hypothetical protein
VIGFEDEAYAFEAFYNLALAPGILLTFDGQVIEPASAGVDTATILGMRLNLRF